MFENLLGQCAAEELSRDISESRLAPAMLFEGPSCSGKGTAALELARIVSCENNAGAPGRAPWNCGCSSCARHRLLLHPDLLMLGGRPFSAEIAAAESAFLKERESPAPRILFIRSLRKLLARFNPVLWEDDPKFSRLGPLAAALEEGLDELNGTAGLASGAEDMEKIVSPIIRDAVKLESDGISDSIPIAQIRRAAWWCRLAPAGRGKFLLIENADRMQEGARNSLLKILEEPPGPVTIVLTSARPGALLPTILSRLRPYRFAARSAETEREVIRRVFRGLPREEKGSLIAAYLDSFLPVSGETLDAAAAFFAASVAYKAALLIKKKTSGAGDLSEELTLLGKYASRRAEAAGLERLADCAAVSAGVLEKAAHFEVRSLFSGFLKSLLAIVSASLTEGASGTGRGTLSPSVIAYNELWKKCAAAAESAVMVYNQSPALALERLFTGLSRGLGGEVQA
jgi:DNA polymerase-3 subunit gamma/tau